MTTIAEEAEQKARELLDKRMTSIRLLAGTRQKVSDARKALKRAENEDVKAYRAALSDGWMAEELRKLGFDEPEKVQRTKRRTSTRRPSQSEPAEEPAEEPVKPAPDQE